MLDNNIKMYNSEDVYGFEQNQQSESRAPSADQQRNLKLNNSRPKNGLVLTHKTNSISGTYARIVPKKPIHDMERLYAENIQLREKIRFLEEDNTKMKTRIHMIEKEREHLVNQICHNDYANNSINDRRASQKGLGRTQERSSKLGPDENRRILHGYKDEISKLKLENGRLKKTVKYTQILELETENNSLLQEMARMKNYMKEVIENTEYESYEKEIEKLNMQLQGQRDSKKTVLYQLKKKDEEVEEIKNKMKIIANRKTELQKKYNRQIVTVKGELHKAKQREKQFILANEKREASKPKAEKTVQCRNCINLRQNLEREQKKNQQMGTQLSAKDKQIQKLQIKLKQNQSGNVKMQQKNMSIQKQQEKQEKQQKQEKPEQAGKPTTRVQQVPKNKTDQVVAVAEMTKSTEKRMERDNIIAESSKSEKQQYLPSNEEEDEEEESQHEYEHEHEHGQGHEEHEEHEDQSDKIDVFHLNMNNGEKVEENKPEVPKEQDKTQKNYQQSFHEVDNKDDISEEVLFQKQEKPKKSNKSGQQQKEKHKQKKVKEKKEEKVSGSKAEKILKETIKYRLLAQRYCYNDFHRDIKSSKATEFTVEELISMLTNEPFFLSEDHLKMVLFGIFQKEELDETDSTSTNTFLKQMKGLIGQFEIQDEEEERLLLSSIQNKLAKRKLLSKMKEESINGEEISKKGFVKVLKEAGGFNDSEVQQCLAEASVISIDIAHINFAEFLQKLSQS